MSAYRNNHYVHKKHLDLGSGKCARPYQISLAKSMSDIVRRTSPREIFMSLEHELCIGIIIIC